MEPTFRLAGRNFRATASVGVAVYPRDAASAEQLLQHAVIAMYRVKTGGRNGSQLFNPGLIG